jgi:sugar phosphate isomerase/epimerase
MPKLAVFPKAFIDDLCITGSMSIRRWIELASTLGVDGLEFYAGFLELKDRATWAESRRISEDAGLSIPMLCCSPDFTHPEKAFREREVEKEKSWIEMTRELGGTYCRVLSGQRRPEVSREDGIGYAVECIEGCLDHAEEYGVTLVIENHYKDNYWSYPEFAQHADVFCELVGRIESPRFGVNYDPSNTILAGEDPIDLLERVKDRVLTMHASDRFLTSGSIDDLRREELDSVGYAERLSHGTIGRGLNDYDKIFSILAEVGFDSWVSIEDGVDGMEQLHESVAFLKKKIAAHF